MIRRLLTITAVLAGVVMATPARADAGSDKAAITDRLRGWAEAFNARNAAGVCDVFAPDLVSTVPEVLDGNRDTLCTKLAALLAKPELTLHYDSPGHPRDHRFRGYRRSAAVLDADSTQGC
ncbi:hypothetical protein PQR57_21100 [Paraburkholderia dipogonis]|uniref:Nuclear transport factor 2 family protein n=1 Tax=Paraburkholderia dipogonis TaxID=1211383 RepID=A0ABW9AW22_9BURK